LLGIPTGSPWEFREVIMLLTVSSAIAMLCGNLSVSFACEGRYTFSSIVGITISVLQAASLFSIALLGGKLVLAAWGMLAFQITSYLLLSYGAHRWISWFQIGFSRARISAIRELLSPAVASLAIPMGQSLNYQAPRLIIGSVLGPAAVTIFVAHRQLTRFILMLLNLNIPLNIEATMAYGRGEPARFVSIIVRGMQGMLWACTLGSMVLLFLGPFIFHVWIGNKIPFNYSLMSVLVIVSLAEVAWKVLLAPAWSLNKYLIPAIAYVCLNAALIPIAYIAAQKFDLLGVAVSVLIADLAIAVFATFTTLAILEIRLPSLIGALVKPPLWSLGVMLRLLVELGLKSK
jgi:O-antigen/teichoic acid export membrane protein